MGARAYLHSLDRSVLRCEQVILCDTLDGGGHARRVREEESRAGDEAVGTSEEGWCFRSTHH